MSLLAPGREGPGLEFHLAGIPIRLEWTFLVWTLVLGSLFGDLRLTLAWLAIVTVSILVHELGHAAALRGWGVPSRIVLHALGGATMHQADLPTRWSRIAVSLAGPAAGMVLLGLPALVVDAAWPAPDPWNDVLVLLVWVNLGWALVNLLPILPLDGGHVALELIDAGTRGRGEVPTHWLSVAVAVAAGVWAFSIGFVFAALFAGFFVVDNLRALRQTRDREVAGALRPAADALEAGDTTGALALSTSVLARAKDPRVRAMAVELAAWAHVARDDLPAAARVLQGHPHQVDLSGHLRALVTETDRAEAVNATVDAWLDRRFVPAATYTTRLAATGLLDTVTERLLASRAEGAEAARLAFQHTLFVGGRYDDSARLGERIVASGETHPTVAYNVACAHARAGRPDDALAGLATAVDLGFDDRDLLDGDPDLDALRADDRFAPLRDRMRPTRR